MDYLSRYNLKAFIEPKSEKPQFTIDPKKKPKISVITASYNQGQFLERTVLSVINQNYGNLEFIVIDGGSTDNSVAIIKKYEQYITYWVSEKDSGQAEAINKGLKMATGDLLCFQNSDDLFCENSFEILSDFYQKNPNFDCYFGDMLFIDAEDNVIEILKTADFDINLQILEGVQVFNQSMFFKKDLGEKFGYLDAKLNFVLDYENVLRWAKNGAKFTKVDKLMGAFRKHEDAKTTHLEAVRKTEHEVIKNKYFDLIFFNKNTSKVVYLLSRLRKIYFFVKKLDFEYIFYRYSLKK